MPNPAFVFLTRQDEVRQAISLAMAARTAVWRSLSGKRKRDAPAYDFDGLLRRIAVIQRANAHWNKFFDANGIAPFRMTYEDLAADYAGMLAKLFAFLGRPGAAIVPPRLGRQADERSDEIRERFLLEFQQRFGTRIANGS